MTGYDDGPLPGGFPERHATDVHGTADRSVHRRTPAHFTCACGAPAWRFPERGVGFCGFCPASAADLEARAAAKDREDVADEMDARREREEESR